MSALEARGLARAFRGGAGVHGVDLTVEPGEIHALVGLNGAGKSTLLKLLLGMLRPDRGEVRLLGTPLSTPAAVAWSAVGHLVEAPLAYPELSVRANSRLAARLHGLSAAAANAAAEAGLAELDLTRYAAVTARRLSLGNRQRLGLAAALAHDPRLIVLDEPSNALDPAGVILVRESLRRRVGAGAAALVSSHHLDEVARIADRITVVNDGRVVGALDPRGTELERAFFELVLEDDRSRGAA